MGVSLRANFEAPGNLHQLIGEAIAPDGEGRNYDEDDRAGLEDEPPAGGGNSVGAAAEDDIDENQRGKHAGVVVATHGISPGGDADEQSTAEGSSGKREDGFALLVSVAENPLDDKKKEEGNAEGNDFVEDDGKAGS